MRDLNRRLIRLEASVQFMPGIAAMSDEEVVGLMAHAMGDGPRFSAILDSMPYDQMKRIHAALEELARLDCAERAGDEAGSSICEAELPHA